MEDDEDCFFVTAKHFFCEIVLHESAGKSATYIFLCKLEDMPRYMFFLSWIELCQVKVFGIHLCPNLTTAVAYSLCTFRAHMKEESLCKMKCKEGESTMEDKLNIWLQMKTYKKWNVEWKNKRMEKSYEIVRGKCSRKLKKCKFFAHNRFCRHKKFFPKKKVYACGKLCHIHFFVHFSQ